MSKIYRQEEFKNVRMEEIGQKIIGRFVMTQRTTIGKNDGQYSEGWPATLHYIVTKNGPVYVFGTADINFGLAQVDPGTNVEIVRGPKIEVLPGRFKHQYDVTKVKPKKRRKRKAA